MTFGEPCCRRSEAQRSPQMETIFIALPHGPVLQLTREFAPSPSGTGAGPGRTATIPSVHD